MAANASTDYLLGAMPLLDVLGASGAAYRFRRVQLAELPINAGNVVAVSVDAGGRRYVLCGAARSLHHAAPALEAALLDAPDARIYVRLNVARGIRDAEHADIVAAVHPAIDLPDLD